MKINNQFIAIGGILTIFVGLITSRILISLGMIILIANGVIFSDPIKNLKKLFANKPFVVITSLFFLHLLSGLLTEDMPYYLERLRIKIPFLVLPFAFTAMGPLSKRTFNILLFCFFSMIILTCIGTTINYLLDYKNINATYAFAKVMPTTISHIRFSLMIVFAIIIGIYFYINDFILSKTWEKYLYLCCTLFLFLFLHILAVRSGLLAVYVTIFYLIIKHSYDKRKFITGFISLLILLSLPVGSYYLFPSFTNKINYMKYDISSYFKNKHTGDFSDGGRLVSIWAGIELGNTHPFFGVGIGNLKQEMNKQYETNYPFITEDVRHIPHNQLVAYYAAFGIAGFLWFLFVLFYPVFFNGNYKKPLIISLSIIIFTSFLSEATIEGQIGTAFYLTFLLLLLHYQTRKELMK